MKYIKEFEAEFCQNKNKCNRCTPYNLGSNQIYCYAEWMDNKYEILIKDMRKYKNGDLDVK